MTMAERLLFRGEARIERDCPAPEIAATSMDQLGVIGAAPVRSEENVHDRLARSQRGDART